MPIKDVSIGQEVHDKVKQGHGVLTIPSDVVSGIYHGLKKKFGFERVVNAATSDPGARYSARRAVGQRTEVLARQDSGGYNSEKVRQVLARSSQAQTEYLISIDNRLKEIEQELNMSNNTAARDRAEAKIRQIKKDQQEAQAALVQPGVRRGGLKEKTKDFVKDTFTIGNFLRYGAAMASTGFDVYQGTKKSGEWGTNPIMGGLMGLIAGPGKGGATNAIKKGVELGTLGGMLAGPMGALVGTVLGAVFGWLGGDEGIKVIKDLFDTVPETIMRKFAGEMEIKAQKEMNAKVEKYLNGPLDWVSEMGDKLLETMKLLGSNIKAWVLDHVGGILKAMSKLPFMDALGTVGDMFETAAKKTKDDATDEFYANKKGIEDKYAQKKETRQEGYAKKISKLEANNTLSKHYEEVKKDRAAGKAAPDFTEMLLSAITPNTNVVKEALNPNGGDELTNPQLVPTMGKVPSNEGPPPNFAKGLIKRSASNINASIGKDLTVGDVPGEELKNVVEQANQIPAKSGKLTHKIDPAAMASIVAIESGGKKDIKDGAAGEVGITQMKDDALEDVNKNFGLSLTKEMLRNYQTAILASTLFMRLKLQQNNGDLKEAFRAYNGAGPRAMRYSRGAIQKYNDFNGDASGLRPISGTAPQVIPPSPKDNGSRINGATTENAALKEANATGTSAPSAPVVTNVSNVQQSRSFNLPSPNIRNDDPSIVRTTWGGFIG